MAAFCPATTVCQTAMPTTAMRTRQAGDTKQGKTAERSGDHDRGTLTDYANSRSVQGRDYGRDRDAGPTPGDTGRIITRKGPA